MIDIFLWWAVCAFLGVLLLHYLILYAPTSNKILTTDAQNYPNYRPEAFGLKVIPALLYCTPFGKKLVRLYWFLLLTFPISLGVYFGEN